MIEAENDTIKRVRSYRLMRQLWLGSGVLFYGLIIGQAISANRLDASEPWLDQNSTLAISIMMVWGLWGYVLNRTMAGQKPR